MLCKPAYSCVVFKCSSPICFAGAHVSVADVLNFFLQSVCFDFISKAAVQLSRSIPLWCLIRHKHREVWRLFSFDAVFPSSGRPHIDTFYGLPECSVVRGGGERREGLIAREGNKGV